MNAADTRTSIARGAAEGYRSTIVSQAVRVLCKAGAVVVMARLVPPAEHGRYAMAAAAYFVLVLFRDCGLGAAALQARDLDEAQRSALWRAHLLLGIALAAVGLACARPLAAFYHEPQVAGLLAWMSVAFLVLGANAWPRVLLARELRFAAINWIETVAAVAATVAMIVAGWKGAGAYSFVVFLLVSEVVVLAQAWRACTWRPTAAAEWRSLRAFASAGGHVTGYNVLLAIVSQLDSFLLGRWFGPATLGFYNRPNQLLALANQHLSTPMSQVLLATLSRLPADSPEFRAQVRDSANLIAHLTLPLAAFCAAVPEPLIRLIMGEAWLRSAPLLAWLAVGAAGSYLGATAYSICVAAGQSRRLMAIAAASLAATAGALWMGKAQGPTGIAAAIALANLLLLAPRLWWASRDTSVRLADFAVAFRGPLLVSAALAASAFGAAQLARDFSWRGQLLAGLAAGTLAVPLVALLFPTVRQELARIRTHLPFAKQRTVESTPPP